MDIQIKCIVIIHHKFMIIHGELYQAVLRDYAQLCTKGSLPAHCYEVTPDHAQGTMQ